MIVVIFPIFILSIDGFLIISTNTYAADAASTPTTTPSASQGSNCQELSNKFTSELRAAQTEYQKIGEGFETEWITHSQNAIAHFVTVKDNLQTFAKQKCDKNHFTSQKNALLNEIDNYNAKCKLVNLDKLNYYKEKGSTPFLDKNLWAEQLAYGWYSSDPACLEIQKKVEDQKKIVDDLIQANQGSSKQADLDKINQEKNKLTTLIDELKKNSDCADSTYIDTINYTVTKAENLIKTNQEPASGDACGCEQYKGLNKIFEAGACNALCWVSQGIVTFINFCIGLLLSAAGVS